MSMRLVRDHDAGEIADARAAATLALLMRWRDIRDAELAQLTGMSRTAIGARRTGVTRMTAGDMAELARALGTDPRVFLVGGDDDDVLRWALDHQRTEWAARDSNPEPTG